MAKKVLGVYNSSDDVIRAIEEYQNEGYKVNDLSIIANTRDFPSSIQNEIGVTTEDFSETDHNRTAEDKGFLDTLFSAFEVNTYSDEDTTSYYEHMVGLGFDEEAAREYERDINSGRILLLGDRDAGKSFGSFTETTASDQIHLDEKELGMDNERTIKLREEQLDVSKDRVQTGEVKVHKEVVEEPKSVNVPVKHEEVYVERRESGDAIADTNTPIGNDETIRVPIIEEKVEVMKKPVVTEELVIGEREVEETEQVTDQIKREEAKVETDGDAEVNETTIDRSIRDNKRL